MWPPCHCPRLPTTRKLASHRRVCLTAPRLGSPRLSNCLIVCLMGNSLCFHNHTSKKKTSVFPEGLFRQLSSHLGVFMTVSARNAVSSCHHLRGSMGQWRDTHFPAQQHLRSGEVLHALGSQWEKSGASCGVWLECKVVWTLENRVKVPQMKPP